VRSLQASPLLFGYRDAPAVAVDAIEDLLLRVAALADDLPEVVELGLNPIEVSPSGVRIAGASVAIRPVRPGRPTLIRSLD
jgi:hypothetical protein